MVWALSRLDLRGVIELRLLMSGAVRRRGGGVLSAGRWSRTAGPQGGTHANGPGRQRSGLENTEAKEARRLEKRSLD